MDSDFMLALLHNTAEALIRPRFLSLAEGEIFLKGADDLVTIADREAEVAITSEISRRYPTAVVLGEEATANDASLVRRFQRAVHAFTVDPVDGTHNFVNGSPDYAVMVSELQSGEVVRSWVVHPEHGLAFAAEKGSGASCNGTLLPRLIPDDDPIGWRGSAMDARLREQTIPGMPRLAPIRSCAGIDYSLVARGAMDFATFSHAHPWDHAPGALLVSEVGGVTLSHDGSHYSPRKPGRWVLSAGSAHVAHYAHRRVFEVLDGV